MGHLRAAGRSAGPCSSSGSTTSWPANSHSQCQRQTSRSGSQIGQVRLQQSRIVSAACALPGLVSLHDAAMQHASVSPLASSLVRSCAERLCQTRRPSVSAQSSTARVQHHINSHIQGAHQGSARLRASRIIPRAVASAETTIGDAVPPAAQQQQILYQDATAGNEGSGAEPLSTDEQEQVDAALAMMEAERMMENILPGLQALDSLPQETAAEALVAADVQVPDNRLIDDPVQINLIGEGLPIITGEEWPEMYWHTLTRLAAEKQVALPRPHPKFSMQDLARIAQRGPQFSDVVLEHAEASVDKSMWEAYNYVPLSVLGDFATEVEPKWEELQQLNFFDFYQGLRRRNWTSPQFQALSEPWQLKFFQCGYRHVTGWPGWRCVVTRPDGSRSWVDMPYAGDPAWANSEAVHSPLALGYIQAFQQVYEAYEQRVPETAAAAYAADPYNTDVTKAAGYDCPGETLLPLSYHVAENPVQGEMASFLIEPTWQVGVEGIRAAVERSGIQEIRELRDRVVATIDPYVPKVSFGLPNIGFGPLYFVICLTLGIVVPAMRRGRILDIKTLEEDPGAAMEFARSKSEARKEGLTGVVFKDVAGLDPILQEVLEVVEFLKDPKMFSKLGARPPKGILMEGDPGTGKTLLAKALAGEAMVPFYQMTGTEFTEGIVGVGAARVRDLFKRARASAPCVIFVDEIDALGLKRSEGGPSSNTNEEREQTLNQLLTEMDGFTPDTGVVFLGATNRADLLDPALLRPGRFDRKIRMPKPDTEGRFEILQLHLRNKKIDPEVDLMQLARDLPGLVGADLANIVNEATLVAVREGRSMLTVKDVYAGVDRFTQGEKRPALPTTYKLPITVFSAKEVGIALVAAALRDKRGLIEPVERVSIQPKGRSYSRTLFARGTDEDYHMMTRGKLLDRIRVALAGGIAVRVALGEPTNQNLPDIKRAYNMANKLVFYYGMSDFGLTMWAAQPYSSDFAVGSGRPRKVVSSDAMDAYADWPTVSEDFRFDPQRPSDVTWHRYTDAVHRVLKQCYEEVWEILESRRDGLWAGIQALAKEKELLGSELRDILDKYPPRYLPNPPKLDDMTLFTEGRKDAWPYNIPWLDDAVPKPYWVRKEQEEAAAAAAATAAGGTPMPVSASKP